MLISSIRGDRNRNLWRLSRDQIAPTGPSRAIASIQAESLQRARMLP
jgi:hypothetical protein